MLNEDYLYKVVYIVIGDEEDEISEIRITETWGELLEILAERSPITDSETRVFQGTIAPARYIPAKMRGRSAYLLHMTPHADSSAIMSEIGDCQQEIAENIEEIVNNPQFPYHVGIDDFYLVFAYQIETCLSVPDEQEDDEAIEACRNIALELMVMEEEDYA